MDKRENQIRSASKALFISFEGIDGCGKSTLMDHLGTWLEESAIPYLKTREPGGTELGEQIRSLLLNPAHRGMDRRAEVLLYTASRAQLTGKSSPRPSAKGYGFSPIDTSMRLSPTRASAEPWTSRRFATFRNGPREA